MKEVIIGSPGNRTQNLSVKSRVLYHWVSDPLEYRVNYNGYSKLSVLNDEKKKIIRMNFNVVGQLISTFFIVSIGPAIIAYLAYKKAL